MSSSATSRTTTAKQTHRSTACRASELKIVQEQAGHDHASTTSIYTCVSSDFRTRTLRRALDATVEAALKPARRA
ncbi:hypothetical protein GCM10010339_86120 [Streptomyces alanosinicus]|uniref:Integrase n=1 Tax=Streptomyces alanosinicus TaxID=68171 RepID=A0A918YSL0_9ACTN|nr:hypothetical protein GCM10010339_86120 [Streptomyces alanosinicus]